MKKNNIDHHFHADFYGFVIDSEKGLSFAGQAIDLPPKEFKLLLELISHAGNRVSKEQLIVKVWRNRPTSDESISRCLSVLKSRLRELSPGIETLIRTEYGQGYRFVGQIGSPATYVNEENFFLLMNASNNLIVLKDKQSRWQIANSTALNYLGLKDKPWQGKQDTELAALCDIQYQPIFSTCTRTDREAWETQQLIEYTQAFGLPNQNQKKKAFSISKTPLFETNGSQKAIIVVGQDITDRLETEHQSRLVSQILTHSDDAVVICDNHNKIVFVNEAFTKSTGFSFADVTGRNPRILASKQHNKDFFNKVWESIINTGTWHGEILGKHQNGEIYLKWLNISKVLDFDGSVRNYVCTFADISKHKTSEASQVYLAYHDPLTQLPNRLLLADRFAQATGIYKRYATGFIALLFLDINRFREVNELLGHEIGDRLLITIAKRLEKSIRETDTLCCLGGDQFVILLKNIPNPHTVSLLAEKILQLLEQAIEIDDFSLVLSACIGISVYPTDGDDFESVLKNAETAMYHAKQNKHNSYHYYDAQINVQALNRQHMRTHLQNALAQNQFELYYQPQFNLNNGDLIGLEALIRWHHPENGLMLPQTFISIAEENGLILAIGEWVIHEACRQAKAWQQQNYAPIRIAVNLSAIQFKHPDLTEIIHNKTLEHSLEPKYLEFELTQSVLLQDVDNILDTIKNLKNQRFSLAIDNFAGGLTSLSHLKHSKIDKLKIDQSLINNLQNDPNNTTIIRSIIQLAEGFGFNTIAEGIETPEQVELLRLAGCQEGQGYYFAHPQPATKIVQHLKPANHMTLN